MSDGGNFPGYQQQFPGYQPQPAAPPPHYRAAPPPQKGRWIAIGAVFGFLFATGVGSALYFTGVLDSPKSVDTNPISLPDSLPGVQAINEVAEQLAGDRDVSEITDFNTLTEEKLTESLSQAYEGAAADVRLYSDPDLDYRPTVTAVRAASPGLWLSTYQGPEALERLQLAELPREIVTTGDVQCEVARSQVTPAGGDIDPENTLVISCQRTGPSMTIRVYGSGQGEVNGVAVNVALINALWTELADD